MRKHYAVVAGLLAAFALAVLAIRGLQAQPAPPVYYIAEITVTDLDGYEKEYAPKATASVKAYGGRILAAGQEVTSIEGDLPAPRIALVAWDSMEQFKSWRSSAQFKEGRKTGERYATFRSFVVQGLLQ